MQGGAQENHTIISSKADLRAEALAAELVGKEYGLEQIFFEVLGSFSRPHSHDVASITREAPERKDKATLKFKLNRDGMYDHLPQGLFHRQVPSQAQKNIAQLKEEIIQHRKEAISARKFFAPFDHEIVHLKLLIELNERNASSFEKTSGDTFNLENLWGLPAFLESGYKARLLPRMPEFHDAKGFPEKSAMLISAVLGMEVEIEQSLARGLDVFEEAALGEAELGRDAVLAGWAPLNHQWKIKAQAPDAEHVEDMLEGGKVRMALEYLLTMLMPAHYSYNFEIEIGYASVPLGTDEDTEGATYLGYNTILSPFAA